MPLSLTYQFFDLPLRHEFRISRYSVSVQKTVIAIVSDGEISGYGEATANPYYGSTQEKIGAALDRMASVIAKSDGRHPVELWPMLKTASNGNYFALCAADVAYWDYFARKNGKTLRSYFSASGDAPITSYTIGIAPIAEMKAKISGFPWPLYKIKLGTENDMEIVRELRAVTDAKFRVDANAAWNLEQAISNSEKLKNRNVEFIEQPLPASDIVAMKRVKRESQLPCFADESCQREEDVEHCADQFHGINIKLMKCGGITPALRMIDRAKVLGLNVMAGCMTESTIGISALAQIGPLLDFIDADGALLLASDIATGVTFREGKIVFNENVGAGSQLSIG